MAYTKEDAQLGQMAAMYLDMKAQAEATLQQLQSFQKQVAEQAAERGDGEAVAAEPGEAGAKPPAEDGEGQ